MKMTVVERAVRQSLRDDGELRPGEKLVVALSGGPDSVSLLHAVSGCASRQGFSVVAAHLDHLLRKTSGADAAFCAELCERLGIAFRAGRADVAARAKRDGCGIEEAAREERHAFLRAVAADEGARFIALAHTQDDQAETLLLRLLRGAGSVGLSAMRPRQGDLLRPLLGVSRADVERHLATRGLQAREDETNRDLRVPRNRVRHELIPYLERHFNPGLRPALARTAELLAAEADAIGEKAAALVAEAATEAGPGAALHCEPLRKAPRAVARQALRIVLAEAGGLRGVGQVHVERLLDLVADPGATGRSLPLPGRRRARIEKVPA
jgi:tRNA(Ile)-lysidine synthase